MAIRLQLFGAPKVAIDGESFVLPCERRSQLLVLLALKRAWVGRAELAAMFWPEQPEKLAYANLRKTLFRLQSVPWGRAVELEGGAVRVDAATDVADFEAALAGSRTVEALALRTGELLAGFDAAASEAWQGWLGFERDRLRAAWRGAALARLGDDIDPAEGVELSARLLESDPLDEAALRAHMTWLAQAGQSARARQAYQAFVGRLASDLGLPPGAELVALHDTLGSVRMPVVPLEAVVPAAYDAEFIGRSVELKRIAELLAGEDCRLLNLVGPGGVGKTRLALRVLAQLAPAFPDGTVFIPLEDVVSADEVGARIAREIGVEAKRGADPEKQVIEFLRARRMLLVLDNFERVTRAGATLDRLLRACAGLRVVVTSRVRLGLAAEHLLRIDGLPCPEPEDADHLEAFDAVRLFTQAAHRVEPGLAPAAEAAAIVDICRQVEGLPLALELAAAWTRVLSCTEIAAELKQGTELLRADDGAHPERHASIEAVFDQSWRLLAPVERDVLARLSVFRGGFTADAARAVAGAALPVLGALADKSLLRKHDARMQLHPLVHQFAAARLTDDARAATEVEHARWFHRLLAHDSRAVGSGDRETLRRMDAEFENCRAAWQWAVGHGAADMLSRSESALLNYCDHRLRNEEAQLLVRDALASPGVRADPRCEAHLLARAAHVEYRLDRYTDAEASARRALPLLRAARNRLAEVLCLNVLGSCCLRGGRFAEAREHYRHALQLALAGSDPTHVAAAQDHVGLAEKSLGNYDEALRMTMASLLSHRRIGDQAGEALCLNNLADLHLARGEPVAAGSYLREALAVADRQGLDGPRLHILTNLSEVAVLEGDLAAAEGYARRALEIATAVGNRAIDASMRLQFAQLALLRRDFAAAHRGLAEGLARAATAGPRSLRFAGVVLFAELLAAEGELACAHAVFEFVTGHPDISVPLRGEARERHARLPAVDGPLPAWPGFALDDLVHRIVGEAELAHAPLIAALRGAS
ncbi:MAG: tetratricopeptide repeat protein [Betaproteobacteria bacterium]|nr:tetratricopeptide repeat protein [Betaproteobacteria bacterium]